ncbi:hypothetical protein [Terrabacter terrigena]|uniref:MFS transporter n=1 Tax=Terrabacter terrigena TaxID=574718 RepID=A0ABW3MTZ6_9MICO
MGNLTMVRWVRAAVLSLLVVATTLAAHVSGGGALPELSALLPVCALVTLSAAALLGRPLSWWWSAAVLLAGQAALHGVLQLVPAASLMEGRGGHVPGDAAVHAAPDAGGPALTAWVDGGLDARMAAAHLGAALLVGAWLAAGERAAWSLAALALGTMRAAWLRMRHALGASLATSFVRTGLPSWPAVPVALTFDPAGTGITRRGPPERGSARPL